MEMQSYQSGRPQLARPVSERPSIDDLTSARAAITGAFPTFDCEMVYRQSIAPWCPVWLKPRLLKQGNEALGLLLTNAPQRASVFIGDAFNPSNPRG